jgi:hypothetical protein
MFADIYVLTLDRSATLIDRFLARFLPVRVAAAASYEVPQYSDHPVMVFTDAIDLIRLCEARPDLQHAIYWRHRDLFGEPRAAHVFSFRMVG